VWSHSPADPIPSSDHTDTVTHTRSGRESLRPLTLRGDEVCLSCLGTTQVAEPEGRGRRPESGVCRVARSGVSGHIPVLRGEPLDDIINVLVRCFLAREHLRCFYVHHLSSKRSRGA
jgi:hypothetical protein